jgi:hypothetical protein
MGTMRSIVRSRTGTAAAVVTMAAAGLAVGAGTASAKSDVAISVSSHSVPVGRTLQINASGGSDVAGSLIQLCIDERVGTGGWRTIRCAPAQSQHYQRLRLGITAQHRGMLQFRAQLVAVLDAHHQVPQQTSGTVAVQVH